MVDEKTVERWAQDALARWLPGPADYDAVLEAPQFQIRRLDPQTFLVEDYGTGRRVGIFRVVVAAVVMP